MIHYITKIFFTNLIPDFCYIILTMRVFIPIFIVVYLCIFSILLDYEQAWMHPEVADTTRAVLQDHPTLISRLGQILNWQLQEGSYTGIPNCRTRIFSHAVQIINIIFRNWLFQFFPPHPSLSVTWIMTLILSPFFLYKFMLNVTDDKKIAMLTALVYVSLPGALVPIIMLFHPSKVFANFFIIFLLYAASQLQRQIGSVSKEGFKHRFLFLAVTLLISFFFDEYCLFGLLMLPIFFPKIFWNQYKVYTLSTYALLPVLFVITAVWFLPPIYAAAGYPGFNVLNRTEGVGFFPTLGFISFPVNFVLQLHDHLLAGINAYLRDESISVKITAFLSFKNQLLHAENIRLGSSMFNDRFLTPQKIVHNVLTLGILGLFCAALLRCRTTKDKKTVENLLKALLALILYTLFFSFLHIANNVLSGGGWYGCAFSVFFAILLGSVLKLILDQMPGSRWMVYIFVASLIAASLGNVRITNQAWLALHHRIHVWELDMWLNKLPREELYRKYFTRKPKNNFAVTMDAWHNRRRPTALKIILDEVAPEVKNYLNAELPYIK